MVTLYRAKYISVIPEDSRLPPAANPVTAKDHFDQRRDNAA